MPSEGAVVSSSFRDPSGFLFWRDGVLYRQVNQIYCEDYDLLIGSGLYEKLAASGLLITHDECQDVPVPGDSSYKIIRPRHVPFISYPYEWSFSQLQDAALVTLEIQKKALANGLSLKDASAYNIQFVDGRPQLIDTLSFERYREGRPWVAYRQFCQHFLAPLALMAFRDVRLNQLSRLHLDGFPLDLASALLPFRTRLKFSLLSHIHAHARMQKRYADKPVQAKFRPMSRFSLLALLNSLEGTVRKLSWQPGGSEWAEYYEETNYSNQSFDFKIKFVSECLQATGPRDVWDIGANRGIFSRLASSRGIRTVAIDIDAAAVEKNYRQCRLEQDKFLLPIISDITNPSPGIGWENTERMSLLERGPVDMVLGLALVHHLAISNNLPLARISLFFSHLCRRLIIEFIPKDDSQVQLLLATRDDIFLNYTQEGFEREFQRHFEIERREAVAGSKRILYLMRHRQ